MRDLREEDFVIIVVAVCCTIIMGIGLVDSKIKTNQYVYIANINTSKEMV